MRGLGALLALVVVVCPALGVAASAAGAATRCATSESCVVVQVFGAASAPQRTVQFSASQLAAFPNQVGGYYEVRPGSGSGQVPPGVPIAELLTEAGVTPSAVPYAYVIGSTSYLSRLTSSTRDFDPPGSNEFVNGLQPVFYPIGGTPSAPDTLGYIRPLHSLSDTNNLDFMEVTHGGAFTVEVHLTGVLLEPTLRAGTTTIRVGQSARLTATLANPPATETLDWTWNLATGRDVDTGTKPTLTTPAYDTPGTYYVQASVTGSNGSSGESNTVAITVKARSKTPTAPRTTGPGRGGGPSTNPVGGPVTGAGSRYNGRPGASPSATGDPIAPTAGQASGTSGPPASSSAAGRSAAGRSPVVRPSGGQLVAGFALVEPAGASSANRSAAASPAAAAAARAGGQHVRASLAWVGLACILALLLGGAGLERRRATPGSLYGRKRKRHR